MIKEYNLGKAPFGFYIKSMRNKDIQVQKPILIKEEMDPTTQDHIPIGHKKVDSLSIAY